MVKAGRRMVAGSLLGLALAGCNHRHETEDERIRRQTAEETRQLRGDVQDAAAQARKEAEQARREARDIVAGVRQGLQEDASKEGSAGSGVERVDLNTAPVARLEKLPGISRAKAEKIARRRPYKSAAELVARGLLTQAEYDRIADRVTVHGGSQGSE